MAVLDTEQDQFVCDGTTVVELDGEIDIATAEAIINNQISFMFF